MATGGVIGDSVGSVQADAFKSHLHTTTNAAASGGSPGMIQGNATNAIYPYPTGSTGGNETRPINANVMYCIKY
jgi:hypothetical protein